MNEYLYTQVRQSTNLRINNHRMQQKKSSNIRQKFQMNFVSEASALIEEIRLRLMNASRRLSPKEITVDKA